MNNELVAMLDYFERDRGLDRDVVAQAIEEALISAPRRAVGPANGLRVTLDPKTGDINAIAELEVVERVVAAARGHRVVPHRVLAAPALLTPRPHPAAGRVGEWAAKLQQRSARAP